MEEQDYLVHYGVLGMKWGVRKDKHYKYTSMRTKGLSKKVDKWKKSGGKNASAKVKNYSQQLKISKQTDKNLLKYAKKTSTGKALAQNLLLGPMGAKSYATMRSSGVDRKKAMASQIIAKAAGLAIGVVGGGALGGLLGKKAGTTSVEELTRMAINLKDVTGGSFEKAYAIVSKFATEAMDRAVNNGVKIGASAGALAGSTASVDELPTKKKKKKK